MKQNLRPCYPIRFISFGLFLISTFPNFNVGQTLPLPSEAYSEGECITPQVVNVDINWIVQQRTFYVPIASQFALHRYAETLLSRPPISDPELNSMCLTVEASQGGSALNLTNVGYDDREFRQTCTPGAQGRINCFAVGSSAGVNPTKTRATELNIVAWDARTYMIVVRCVEGFFRDFSVLSTRPSVSHDVYQSVLNITRNLGFDERRIQTTTYDSCIRTSSGLNSSNFNPRTGPFTNSILAAPFSNNVRGTTSVIQHHHDYQSPQQIPLQPSHNSHQSHPIIRLVSNQQQNIGPGQSGQGPAVVQVGVGVGVGTSQQGDIDNNQQPIFQNNHGGHVIQQQQQQQQFGFGPIGPPPPGFGPFGGVEPGFPGPGQFQFKK